MEIKLDHEELTKTIMYTLIDLQVRLISIQDKLGISSDISSDLATLAKYSADEVANDHSGHMTSNDVINDQDLGHMTSNDVIKVDPKIN